MTSSEPFQLEVRVQPRASSRKLKLDSGQVKAYLYSPAEGNKANIELIELLAGVLRLPKRNLKLIRGQKSRTKTVEITGLTQDQVRDSIFRAAGC